MGGRCVALTWSSEIDGRPDWPSDHMPAPWPDVWFECSSLSTHCSKVRGSTSFGTGFPHSFTRPPVRTNNHTENLSKKLNLSTRHTWTTYHFNEGTPGRPSCTWWAPGSNCGKYRLDLSSRGPVLLSPGDLSTCCGVIGRRCCAQQVLIARPLVPSQVFDGQRVSPRVGRLRLRRLRVRVCRPCRRV